MSKKELSGHHCIICSKQKPNENFSGTGQIAHICKDCAKLPRVERATEQMLLRIEGMAGRHINGTEIEWLRGCLRDPRSEVQQAASDVYKLKFQRHERGQYKKGLTALSLEFYLHGEVWHENGDVPVHVRITADHNGTIRLIDYAAMESGCEMQIATDKPVVHKFLNMLIHEWDILFWDEDLSDCEPDENTYLDTLAKLIFGDNWRTDEDAHDETGEGVHPGEPLWSVKLGLSNGDSKEIIFYNQLQSEPQELYWVLTNFFEPKEPYKKERQQVWS